MKQQFQHFNFRDKTLQIIDQANEIISEYTAAGYSLTLRQLYYQFVARGLCPNSQREYNKLGKTISNGRLAGLIDWSAIEDRTRNLKRKNHWTSPQEILQGCADQFTYDLWKTQETRVEVWIEKEALSGVIQPICDRLDIPYFSCRGYVSQSEAWKAGQRVASRAQDGQETIILHLGDHDPSGMDMTRDNADRVALFSEISEFITVERIALNMDQIEQFNPPPNPSKETDSRNDEYVKKYGNQSWELDALEPAVIEGLIATHVEDYVDHFQMDEMKTKQRHARQQLQEIADSWSEK